MLWVSTLSALSSSNKCVGVQLTKDGRLSFSRLARLLGISISDPDCLDTWTLGDVNLIIDKESKELLTEGPVWGLYDLPLGTKAQPVQLCTGQTVGTCSHGKCPICNRIHS